MEMLIKNINMENRDWKTSTWKKLLQILQNGSVTFWIILIFSYTYVSRQHVNSYEGFM